MLTRETNTVRSEPLKSAARAHDTHIYIPIAGLIIGAILWPIGARYTIDGLAWLGNAILSFLRVPYQLPLPLPWQAYAVMVWLPFVCSRVEWRWPLEKLGGRWRFAPVDAILVWLVVASADFLTTYFGVRNPSPDAWAISQEISKALVWSGILSAILTFGPEWMVRSAWRRLRG